LVECCPKVILSEIFENTSFLTQLGHRKVVLTYIYCKEGSWKHENNNNNNNKNNNNIPNKIIGVIFFRRETEGRSGYRNHSYFYFRLKDNKKSMHFQWNSDMFESSRPQVLATTAKTSDPVRLLKKVPAIIIIPL
jgi:hypothetical protein